MTEKKQGHGDGIHAGVSGESFRALSGQSHLAVSSQVGNSLTLAPWEPFLDASSRSFLFKDTAALNNCLFSLVQRECLSSAR